MMGVPLALCFVIGCSIGVHSQPLDCRSDEQCSEGYYCEKSANRCYECLRCQDLKREPPLHLAPSACIKSVVDCGSCIKGLVVDHRGNLNAECVPPDDGREEAAVLPPYVWVLIVMGLLLLGLVIAVVLYVLKNPDALKVLVSTRTSFQSACYGPREPNAPDAPPPYNPAHYTAVRAESPSTFMPPAYQSNDEETNEGLMKRAPASRPQHAREAADTQAARVYKQPAYLRGHDPPASPVSPNEVDNDNFDSHFALHDEDTTESLWTPHGANNNVHVNGIAGVESDEASGAEGAGAAVAGAGGGGAAGGGGEGAVGPPPAKMLCTRQNSNARSRDSNAGSGDSNSDYPRSPSPAQSNPAFVINVVQINNSK